MHCLIYFLKLFEKWGGGEETNKTGESKQVCELGHIRIAFQTTELDKEPKFKFPDLLSVPIIGKELVPRVFVKQQDHSASLFLLFFVVCSSRGFQAFCLLSSLLITEREICR